MDYHIVNRIRTCIYTYIYIYDDVLQQEALQTHLKHLVAYCSIVRISNALSIVGMYHEAQNEHSLINGLDIESHDLAKEEMVAALSAYIREKHRPLLQIRIALPVDTQHMQVEKSVQQLVSLASSVGRKATSHVYDAIAPS